MTSIEFLKTEYIKRGDCLPSGVFQDAKEMHKQEIEQAFKHGKLPTFLGQVLTAEQYYQETFVSKGSDECHFEPTTNTSSATICVNCGREKFLHKF